MYQSSDAFVPFSELGTADLVRGTVYGGGRAGNQADDPLHPLLGVGNAGGFRPLGSPTDKTVRFTAIYASGAHSEWPDRFDEHGNFIYYGDQRTAGKPLLETPRMGNVLLDDLFRWASSSTERHRVPPVFLFTKSGRGRDSRFEGLLVPGGRDIPQTDQLMVTSLHTADGILNNYRATFTQLGSHIVRRAWIESLKAGRSDESSAPSEWTYWQSQTT